MWTPSWQRHGPASSRPNAAPPTLAGGELVITLLAFLSGLVTVSTRDMSGDELAASDPRPDIVVKQTLDLSTWWRRWLL